MMKPKTNLIVNSVCFVLLSPLVGIIASILIVRILLVIIWSVAALMGLISSLFFEINISSLGTLNDWFDYVPSYIIIIAGCIGGLIWSYTEVKSRWIRHKKDGTGW